MCGVSETQLIITSLANKSDARVSWKVVIMYMSQPCIQT